MKRLMNLVCSTAVGASVALIGTTLWAADAPSKNWTPPAQKISAPAPGAAALVEIRAVVLEEQFKEPAELWTPSVLLREPVRAAHVRRIRK